MIAPQELRLGNKVMRNGIVVTVDNQTFWDIEKYPDQYEPIELTEEWLLKFEFEKKWDNIPGVGTFYFYEHPLFNHRITQSFSMPVFGAQIKSVHHLQNIVYAICGEELTIKEQS